MRIDNKMKCLLHYARGGQFVTKRLPVYTVYLIIPFNFSLFIIYPLLNLELHIFMFAPIA